MKLWRFQLELEPLVILHILLINNYNFVSAQSFFLYSEGVGKCSFFTFQNFLISIFSQ